MDEISQELKEFLVLMKNHTKMAAMLAPSFVVDFSYPEIIGKLRKIGFSYVLEVSAGAAETNRQVIEKLKADNSSRFIMSPCPSVVRLVRKKYPQLVKYLAMTDTPMSATAKIVLNKYPGVRPVFIGPCVAKKLEAREEYFDLNILVLTYKEILKVLGDQEDKGDKGDFDVIEDGTRIYPLGGGLSVSAKLSDFLKTEEIKEVNGFYHLDNALKEFDSNKNIRVLDVLFCEGGCINGPGVVSKDGIGVKKKKVLAYANWKSVDSS